MYATACPCPDDSPDNNVTITTMCPYNALMQTCPLLFRRSASVVLFTSIDVSGGDEGDACIPLSGSDPPGSPRLFSNFHVPITSGSLFESPRSFLQFSNTRQPDDALTEIRVVRGLG